VHQVPLNFPVKRFEKRGHETCFGRGGHVHVSPGDEMPYFDSGAMLTAVRAGGISGSSRELRRAHEVVEDSRNAATQPYAAVTNPTATTILSPRAPQVVVLEGNESHGGSVRFLSLGVALGVILAFLLSGHNLVRLRTAVALAILPDSALHQLQQQPAIETMSAIAPQAYAATGVVPIQPVAVQTPFQPVPQTPAVVSTFPIPLVDVTHLPKHNPTTRQASRPRSGGAKSAAPADETAAPFDARTIEASLND
jgi:hypothetical protein